MTPTTTRHEMFGELLAPRDAYRPFGRDDGLSNYLYYPATQHQSAEGIIAFIDEAEGFVDKQDIDSQLNHEKILRLMTLVADLPGEIPEEERLRAWEHLLAEDWVHMFSRVGDLGIVLHDVQRQDPGLALRVTEKVESVLVAKRKQLLEAIDFGDELTLTMNADDGEPHGGIMGYTRVLDEAPDALPTYNSVLMLSLVAK